MIGLSSSWCAANGLSIYDGVKRIQDLGFELVEIGAAHRYEGNAFETLKRIKKDFGDLRFTVHSYFPPLKEVYLFNPCYGPTKRNKLVVDNLFKTARILEASLVSIHHGHLVVFEYQGPHKELPGFPKFKDVSKIGYEKGFRNALEVFRYALKLSDKSSVKFAIENMPPKCYRLLKKKDDFVKVFNLIPELNFLYDIGHDVRSGVDTYAFFELRNRIIEVHLHDVVDNLDHQRLGKGRLDLTQVSRNKDLLRKLPVIFEHAANVSEKEILEERQLVESLLR